MGEVTVSIPLRRRLCAILLGAGVALFAWLTGNSDVFPPELWDEMSVAAGLRPPAGPMPGIWRAAVSLLLDCAGVERTLGILHALGPVSLGLLASFMYLFLGEVMPVSLKLRMGKWGGSRWVVQLLLMQGALCFVMSAPVWRAGRVFSTEMMLLLAGVILMDVFCWALRGGRPAVAILMSAAAGFFAADTVFAFVLPPAFSAFVKKNLDTPGVKVKDEFRNPLLRLLAFRRIFTAFFFMWFAGIWLNTRHFWGNGGLAARDWTKFMYFLHYLHGYALELLEAATPLGWALIVIAVAAPFVIAVSLARVATDDDRLLSCAVGFLYLIVGVFSFTQSTGWTSSWFWLWGDAPQQVSSRFLLCGCLFLSSVTVTLAFCVVGVEFYFRSDSRVAQSRFEDAVEKIKNWPKVVASIRRTERIVRTALVYEPVVVLAVLAAPKFSSAEREAARLVNDCIRQTAEECGSARLLFTDGLMDSAVEFAAMRQGGRLKALSMIAGGTPYERCLRTRGETDDEDRQMLESGAADALRTWVKEGDERASDIAVQVGIELWRRNGLAVPEYGGLVARTAPFPEEERERAAAAARSLAARALDLHADGSAGDISDPSLAEMLSVAEWRLARMCRMRADAADAAGRGDESVAETELAEALDNVNAVWRRIRDSMEWTEPQGATRFTPREGMKHWLARGDFGMARIYALRLLRAKPYDSAANFAVGMSYFEEEKYNRAEAYLKRSLERKPDEPAALNNIAVIQANLGRLEEAETNALKAASLNPDSSEIRSTLAEIRRRLEARGESRDGSAIDIKEKGSLEGLGLIAAPRQSR
ncbi:MAG: tetratricopeptide repeat protein [Kiritimatiellae bacterium]|nr:tetratricopeptide repeat protein [Kiritimatiellia bacterium]